MAKIASQILSINLCTTSFSYLALILCLIFVPIFKNYELLIIIHSTTIFFTTMGADWLNTAMEDFKFITIRTFAFQFIALIAMFLFVHKPEDYLIYAVISVISLSGANIVNIFYRRKYCKVKFTLNMDWKNHLPPIILLFAMLLSQNILSNLSTTMLGIIKGNYQVGLYTTAIKIISIVSQVVASIAWVMMPQLSYGFSKKDYNEVNKLLRNAAVFTVALGLPCVVGINILAPEIIEIIGGREYLGAVTCLRISTIAMALSFCNGIYGNMILLPSNRENQFMKACIVSAIVNIILNFLLIPQLGLNAAAITTVISSLVITFFVISGIEKEIHFGKIKPIILAPIIGCVGILMIGILTKSLIDNLWIKSLVVVSSSGAFYVMILIKMKNEFAMSMIIPIVRRLGKVVRRRQ